MNTILKKIGLRMSSALLLLSLIPPLSVSAETTVPAYSWWSQSRNDNFFSSDPKWSFNPKRVKWDASGELMQQKIRRKKYTSLRFEGFLYSPRHTQPKGTVPLYSWWNASWTDNLVTSKPRWSINPEDIQWDKSKRHIKNNIVKRGYKLYRLEGYIFDPKKPQPFGTLPLFSWRNPKTKDRFSTTHPEWSIPVNTVRWGDKGQNIINTVKKDGYSLYRLEGFVFDPKQLPPEQRYNNQTWPQEICLPTPVSVRESATLVKGQKEAKKRTWRSWKSTAQQNIQQNAHAYFRKDNLKIVEGSLNLSRKTAPFKCYTEDFHHECRITTTACASVTPSSSNHQPQPPISWGPIKNNTTGYVCLDKKVQISNQANTYHKRSLAINNTWELWHQKSIQALNKTVNDQYSAYNFIAIENSLEPKRSQIAPSCSKRINDDGDKKHRCLLNVRPCAKFKVINDKHRH